MKRQSSRFKRKRQLNSFHFCGDGILSIIICFSLLVFQSHASTAASSHQPEVTYWEEEVPQPIKENSNNDKADKRRLFWQGRMDEPPNNKLHDDNNPATTSSKPKPHSMRTNEWKLDLKISQKECNRLGIENKTLLLDFCESGYVKIMTNTTSTLAIGTWKLHPSGITWTFPITDALSKSRVTLSCHGDLILNPFGSHARMVRGTIVKNCRKWFRPVVATFTAKGIGQDTVDVSYRDRGFGL